MGNKKTKDKAQALTEQDLAVLCLSSGFAKETILKYYEAFITDCPDGKLSKYSFFMAKNTI